MRRRQSLTRRWPWKGKRSLAVFKSRGTLQQTQACSQLFHPLPLGHRMDRAFGGPVMVASAEGGMDIEEVAESNPDAIVTEAVDITKGVQPEQTKRLAEALGFEAANIPSAQKQMSNLCKWRRRRVLRRGCCVVLSSGVSCYGALRFRLLCCAVFGVLCCAALCCKCCAAFRVLCCAVLLRQIVSEFLLLILIPANRRPLHQHRRDAGRDQPSL